MDFCSVRHYLAQAPRKRPEDVVADAVVLQVPGAVAMLDLLLNSRVNRRTRRNMARVTQAYGVSPKPRWLAVMA